MKALHTTYIQRGLQLVASTFYLFVMTCDYNFFAKVTCGFRKNFGTADVRGVRIHGAHQRSLIKTNIENISIEDVTKSLLCCKYYILRIYFLTHWLPPKTAAVKFSP